MNKDYIRNDSCQFLDIDIPFPMLISHTHLRQKNWFLFPIPMSIFLLDGDIPLNNLVPSYGVYISQLVRFADTCICNVSDFNEGNHLARIRITLPDLTLPHLCVYPQPGNGFPTSYVQWIEVRGSCFLLLILDFLTITIISFINYISYISYVADSRGASAPPRRISQAYILTYAFQG